MNSWTDHLIAREPAERVRDPQAGEVYVASCIYGIIHVKFIKSTETHHVVFVDRVGRMTLRRSETTLYLRQPTRTN